MIRTRLPRVASGLAALFIASAAPVVADTAADLAKRSLAECEHGRTSTVRADRLASFQKGEEIARKAVAMDDKDASAHFALFCNMGEAMRIDGESLQALVGLGKLMTELDRTLELNPNHLDAMAAKGTLLVRLPRMMGGDMKTGEAMLQRVVREDPNAFSTRLTLAKVHEDRGEHDQAVQLANRALEIAQQRGRADKVAEAQTVLKQLGAGHD